MSFFEYLSDALASIAKTDDDTTVAKSLPLEDRLAPLKLIGGLNGLDLWPWLNNIGLVAWLLLFIAPRWKYTKKLTMIPPVICAVVYSLGMVSGIAWPESNPTFDPEAEFPDMMTLQGWVTLFEDPTTVFLGMVHYMVFDFMMARSSVLDSVEIRNASLVAHVLFVIPCTFLTMMFGPMGWLIYLALKDIVLPTQKKEDKEHSC